MTLLNPEFSSRRSDVGRYAESPILAGTNRIAAPMPSSDSTVAGNVPEEARDDSATSVGLLFVHGIGEQKKGDTLVSFAEPLYEWLSRWSAGKSNDLWSVSTADAKITQTDDGAPSHVRVSAERNDSDTKIDILMAEAWWADAFAPPSYTQVARWALLVAPAVVGAYLRPRIQSSQVEAAETLTSEEEVPVVWQLVMVFSPLFQLAIQYGPPLIGRFVIPAVLLIMGAFVLVALQVVIVALLILGFIPRVRASVARLQLYFANGFGDTLTLVERPLRYQAMLSQVRKDLDWLEERCDVVSVIAHSQGAVLANEVIAGRPGKVRNLVTLGGALSKLPTLRAALAHRGRTYGSLACRLSAVLAIGYHLLSAPLDLPTPDSWVLPVAAVSLIYVSMLIDSAWHATSLTPAEAIEGVAKPLPGVAWCDLIGDADPVPEGPLPPVTGAMTSEVQNTGSVARDHVSYLANTEQVLARIWQLILGQEVIAMDRGHIARARVGRRERVNDQRLWPKLVTVAGWVATIVAIGLDGTRAIGEWLLTPLTWLVGLVSPDAGSVVRTDTFLQLSLGSLAVLLGLILVHVLVVATTWTAWDRKARDWFFASLDLEPPGRPVWYVVARIVSCVPLLSPLLSAAIRHQDMFKDGRQVAIILFFVAVILTLISFESMWISATSLDTTTAAHGDRVTLKGSNLQRVTRVRIGTVPATTKRKDVGQLTFVVPDGATTGDITIESDGAEIHTSLRLAVSAPVPEDC